MGSDGDVTRLLERLAAGQPGAADELWSIVYVELRRLADGYLQNERAGHTLEPTALVNEAYLRLCQGQGCESRSRAEFFGVAARAMRRILTDHARRRRAAKRGGGRRQLPLDQAITPLIRRDGDLVELDEALSRLARLDPQMAELVELHFFGGMTFDEAARVLNVSTVTAKRMWKMAKGWLLREISKEA
jgi:RNA polymerase sigma-70 factor (ECF subfamily)